jgi:uncharacterized membrane protein YadS
VEIHAQGTNVEGELADLYAAITRIHETLHAEGTVRIATYVKMLRVAMLLPVVLVIAVLLTHSQGDKRRTATLVPWFLIAFALLVAVNSTGVVPKPAIDAITNVSRWCLVAAIAALGMKTSFKDLFAVGWRPVGLMVMETLWIALLVLVAVTWFV